MSSRQADNFERLLRPHLPRLYRLAVHLAGRQNGAEDLFQEVLTRSYARLDELARVRDPASWLARVMINRYRDDRRRYTRERLRLVGEGELPQGAIDSLAAGADTARAAAAREQLQGVARALEALSGERRLVLLMHDVEGYKLEEIQSITGLPLGTVKSRLHRARRDLRELLERAGTFS